MDALEFLRERKRICGLHNDCNECPFGAKCGGINIMPDEDLERIVAIAEKWSKEHPRKTRQSVFLEQWPEAEIDENGYLMLCPLTVSADRRNRHGECTILECTYCRREFWMQEVE